MDLDRRVRRGRERLDQEDVPPPPPPISAEKSEQLSVLEEKIKNLLEQVESLGEAGQVDEAEALMRKVSQITSVVRTSQNFLPLFIYPQIPMINFILYYYLLAKLLL